MPAITIQQVQEIGASSRLTRRPRHKFYLSYGLRPYAIQPFMIAPILPGETLSSMHFECREVTRPLTSPIIGWGSEYYWFYVRIRDLNERDTLDDLFINPAGATLAATAAVTAQYYGGRGYNFTEACLRRVTETYFRDSGETWNTETAHTGIPKAQVLDQMWMDSLVDTTLLDDGTGDPGATTQPETLDAMMDAYNYLRSMSLTSMTFEDYVATFGVKLLKLAQNKPLLIARLKEFSYPANTINPADGAPTSACSWVFKETMYGKDFATNKAIFAKEPGFIFGVHVVRPKIYFENQVGSMSHHLDTAFSWLPAIMADAPETSLREFTNANGPITGSTNGYWVDMRDLFLYGDQFINGALASLTHGNTALPTAALARKYLGNTEIDALFVSTVGTQCDGVTQLSIKGTQRDYTGQGTAVAEF